MKKKETQKEVSQKESKENKEADAKKRAAAYQAAYFAESSKAMIKIYSERCDTLRVTLKNKFSIEFIDNKEFILEWLSARKEVDEAICYGGKDIEDLPQNLRDLNSVDLLSHSPWNIRIHQHVISKASQMKEDQLYILLWRMQQLNSGCFNYCQLVPVVKARVQNLSEFIALKGGQDNLQILAMVGIEQRPILNKYKTQVTKFSYHQFVMILNLMPSQIQIDQNLIFQKYYDVINDPAFAIVNTTDIIKQICDYCPSNNEIPFYQVRIDDDGNKSVGNILPQDSSPLNGVEHEFSANKFEEQFLTFEESSLLKYDDSLNRWVETEKEILEQKDQEREERAEQNKFTLSRFATFQSAQKLVELLQNIKSLKLKLTEEETNVIGQSGNVIVIGRSGTGKTTCAVLRLFAMEILFHIRVQMLIAKDAKVLQDAATNQEIGLQSVFITASPVLANQIKKYYQKLTSQVKEEIRQKQLKKLKEKSLNPDDPNATKLSAAYQLVQSLHGGEDFDNTKQEDLERKEEDLEHCLSEISIIKKLDEGINDCFEDEFEEDDVNDRFEFSESKEKGKSLKDMKKEDFPSFQTVRSYLMLIEACLNVPFFPRDASGQVVGQEGASSWSNYKSLSEKLKLQSTQEGNAELQAMRDAFYDEDNLEEVYKREMYLLSHANAEGEAFGRDQFEKERPEDRKFEIDNEYFESAFWPIAAAKFKDSNLISCSTLWTEIYSHVKGSSNSFSYPERRMILSDYLARVDLNELLSSEQRNVIYSMSEYYEKWKRKQSGYDLMDVANYLLQEIKAKRASIPSIHFTMIDEVQDLPYALITLFSIVNEQTLFLAGDSAQTIARGVGFRFGELKQALKSIPNYFERQIQEPTLKQLTINFRSHNKILQLSNSVINLLEALFPTSIDILKKERSNIDGFKPIILTDSNLNFLFTLLSGSQDSGDPLNGNIPLEFGCHQVIIVKDNESKTRLPAVLQHAICLTIYEAKGLEFDDVILFDFFADSKSSVNSWGSVGLLSIQQEKMSKETFLQMMTMHDGVFDEESRKNWEEQNFESAYGVSYDVEKDEVSVFNPVKKSQELRAFNRIANAFLCSELKQLYTAITRPKKRLIIFDRDTLKRKQIERFWSMQNLVSLVSEADIEGDKYLNEQEKKNKKQKENDEQIVSKEKSEIVESMKKLLVKNSSTEWFEQGLRMFRFKYFEQAVKCFKKAGNVEYEKKAQAYFEAKINQDQIIKLESNLQLLRKKIGQYAFMKEHTCKVERTAIIKQLKHCKDNFKQIGDKFLEIGRKKQAAKCFFSGGQYENAGNVYAEIGLKKEAAESYLLGGFTEKAAWLYELAGEIQKAVEAFEKAGKWEQILVLLNGHESAYKKEQLSLMRQKYLRLALKQVLEKPQEKQVEESWILEDEENEEIDSVEDDTDQKEEEENQILDDQEGQEIEKEKETEEESVNTFEKIINDKKDKNQIEQSVEVIQNDDNFSEFSILDKECLSAVDGDDEWLQLGDGKSIKELLLQSQSFNDISFSQYSMIEGNYTNHGEDKQKIGNINNSQIIQARNSLGISDLQLQNVVELLLLGDLEFKEAVQTIISDSAPFLSKEIIVKRLTSEYPSDISSQIADLIIKSLVYFSSEKVALHICNRFLRTKQLHQIVISLAAEYSPLVTMNATVLPHFLSLKSSDPRIQQQKILGIVASTALHGILESIEPSMLIAENTSFKLFSSKQLIKGLLLLGFWRKIVFLADQPVGLAIAECFSDYDAYKVIWNNNSNPDFQHDSTQMQIIQMESFVTQNLSKNKITSAPISEIPKGVSHNLQLWQFLVFSPKESNYFGLAELLSKVNKIILRKSDLFSFIEIFDIISSFWQLVRLSTEQLMERSPLSSSHRAMVIEQAKAFSDQFNLWQHSKPIVRGVLSVYAARLVPKALIDVWGSSTVVLSKTSVLSTPNLLKAHNVKNSTNTQENNCFYCDLACEYYFLPLACVFLGISQKIPQAKKSTIVSSSESHGKVGFRIRNQELLEMIENARYPNFSQKEKLKIGQNLKNEELVQFLQYGNTQKYSQNFETIHGNACTMDNKNLKHILQYSIIQAIVNNFKDNDQMILNIPTSSMYFLQALEKKQSLLEQQIGSTIKEKQSKKQMKALIKSDDQNAITLLLNLNVFDNTKYIDNLIKDILERAEKGRQTFDSEEDDNGEFKPIPDQNGFIILMTLMANISDISSETLSDLIEAVRLIPLEKQASKFINSSQAFDAILHGKNIKQVSKAAGDLINSQEFKRHFDNWSTVKCIKHGLDSKDNDLIEKEDRLMLENELALRKTAGFKVSLFIIKNRSKLKHLEQVKRSVLGLSDLFSRTELTIVQVSRWMLENDIYLEQFDALDKLHQRILRKFYKRESLSDQKISMLLDLLEQSEQLVQRLCGQIQNVVTSKGEVLKNDIIDKQIQQFLQQADSSLSAASLVQQDQSKRTITKKNFRDNIGGTDTQKQKVLQLLRKRANLLKQEKLHELKQIRTMVDRKR